MAIDPSIYHAPATRGDVAGIAIKAAMGLGAVQRALIAIQAGGDLSPIIAEISKMSSELASQFDLLAGWTPNDD